MRKILIIAPILLLFFSCKKEAAKTDSDQNASSPKMTELMERANSVFVSMKDLKKEDIPEDKVQLGKMLYFDKRLSKNNTISCNSCHNLEAYGVDNEALSPGDTKELGSRNSPSSFYAFLHFKQFWDGRAETVEEQAKGPILNPVEHGIPSEEFLVNKLKEVKEYQEMFKKVYPNQESPISFNNIADAIGAFERQLSPVSKFDEYLVGNDDALTQQQKDGLQEFMSAKCTTCHNGIALGGGLFQKFGVYGKYYDETNSKIIDNGVFDLTKKDQDKFLFKVPSLRNIAKTAPYFHDGSVSDLKQVVKIMGKLQSDIELNDKQIDDINAFLESLTADIDDKYKKF